MPEPVSPPSRSLRPEDNRRLLDAAAALPGPEGKNERVRQVKRDVAVALQRDPVLIAVREDAIARESGPARGGLLAFTDDEAAAAWAQLRHPSAPRARFARSDELAGGGVPGRSTWLAWLAERRAPGVVVNPAGPLGLVVHRVQLSAARPRRLSRAVGADHPWLGLDARAAERQRIAELRTALVAAASDGDGSPLDPLRPQLDATSAFGSLLWAAEMQYLGGLALLRSGEEYEGAVRMCTGAVGFARIDDLYRSIDGVLDAAGRLLAAPTPKADWQIKWLNELVDALSKMRVGYREQEIQRVTEDAELAR